MNKIYKQVNLKCFSDIHVKVGQFLGTVLNSVQSQRQYAQRMYSNVNLEPTEAIPRVVI